MGGFFKRPLGIYEGKKKVLATADNSCTTVIRWVDSNDQRNSCCPIYLYLVLGGK